MIVLTLPPPISANAYWGNRVVRSKAPPYRNIVITYVTDEARAYRESIAWHCRKVGIVEPMRGRVWVDIALYPQRPLDWAKRAQKDPEGWDDNLRRVDLDNARKVLYDALKEVCFGDDIRVFKDSGEVMEPDEHGARLVVTIREVRRKSPQLDMLRDDVREAAS